MKTAVKSAAKWLLEKAKDNPKLNPVPFPLFKSILEKQITWAREQRGFYLSFDELAENVRAELLKSNIYVMPSGGKKADEKIAEKKTENELSLFSGAEITSPLLLRFESGGEAICFSVLFNWLNEVFSKSGKSPGVKFTAEYLREEK